MTHPLARIVVRRKPGTSHHAIVTAGPRIYHGVIGRGGTSILKREGDGATPAQAVMRPRWLYWRPDRVSRPRTSLAAYPISDRDGWCDAPAHPAYNEPVRLPFASSYEVMQRNDRLYDICVVLDWNMAPSKARHRGSAIFLHATNPGLPPTAGCIAVPIAQLTHLVEQLSVHTCILVER